MSRVSLRDVKDATVSHYGITHEMLLSHQRDVRFARPRFVAYRVARDLTDDSLSQIGAAFGGRDHTTVMHGLKRLEDLRDDEIEDAIHAITGAATHIASHANRHVRRWPFKSRRKSLPLFIRSQT